MPETQKKITKNRSNESMDQEPVRLEYPELDEGSLPTQQDQKPVRLEYPGEFSSTKSQKRSTSPTASAYSSQEPIYEHTEEAYAYAHEAHKDFDDGYEEEPEQTEEPKRKARMKFRDVLAIPLPTALRRRAFLQYFMAIGVILFCIFMSIFYRDPRYMIGVVISIALVYLGISTTLDYANDKIAELTVLCANFNESRFRNKTSVVFRTNEDVPQYFEFILPGKQAHKFQLNAVYVIYFDKDPNKQKVLLGYVEA